MAGYTQSTMPKRSSKLDLNQLAKRIVDEATGEEPITPPPPKKNQAAVELGRLGGKKGGIARMMSSFVLRSDWIHSFAYS
jgi:hypothetical protein